MWRFKTDGFVLSSPAVVGGIVYIGSHDNYLYALDATAGE
jgi:outer membrane protein assembly factor BamB